ncbi:MAG: NADH-quinone oxidoreductase subunit NuoH [Verrucomicrobiae bacterium]|nr:NADH-quinone oxidoreductase subunit NuoH [Verrucomicrobiae bacterium]MCX7722225.1 NADH-quinone oxidoreductase subunit NuoH [Verrucomicrobiae bacterium]MDW7980692.1 NADH-quinone oxidoreductase subunit NuoH [Verrucomicrobiales bacterium]
MILPEPYRLIAYLVGALAFVGLNAAYLVWLERKVAARFQRRPGPTEVGPAGLLQPIADGLKLLGKQFVVWPHADRVLFRLAPAFVLAPALMCLAVIPFGHALCARDFNLGLLLVFAFGSVNVLAILLGGWASRNKYSVIAAARVVSQNVAYEIPMLLVVTTLLLTAGTMNLRELVQQQAGGVWNWNLVKVWVNPLMPVLFLIFYVCMLAETNRAPFDMAEAESELVAGAFTEYAGMGFGLFFMAEYANIVVGASVATVLFLGGWHSPVGVMPGTFWFLVKLYALVFSVMWVRWTFPRTQFYRLLNLSWKLLIPAGLGALLFTALILKLR